MDYCLDNHRFRNLLKQKGYASVNDFADRALIHRNTLSAYLTGRKSVFADAYRRITLALGVDPLDLVVSDQYREYEGAEYSQLLRAIGSLEPEYRQLGFMLIGSRGKETSKRFSDWDVGITGGKKILDDNSYLSLVSFFDDIAEDFGRNVDIVNLDSAPVWFLEKMDYQPKFLGGNREAYNYFLGTIDGIKRTAQAK